jgi:PrtD family type I secretion system ABC transporter
MKLFVSEASKPLAKAIADCRPHLLRVGLFSALVNILYLAPTLYMMQVYDRVVPTGGVWTLFWLTVILGLAVGSLTLLDSIRSRLMVRAALKLNTSLAGTILQRILASRSQGAASREAPMALRELDTLRQSMTGPGIMALFDAPWMPIYLLAAFALHPLLALLIVIGGVILVVLAIISERTARQGNRESHKALSIANAAHDALTNQAEIIRALGMRRALTSRHNEERTAALLTGAQTQLKASRYSAMVKFVRMFLQSLALGAGAWLAVNGMISSGSIIAASVLLSRALQPIEQLVGAWPSLTVARQAYLSLNTLFAENDGEEERKLLLPDPTGAMNLENISLRNASGDGFIVRGITFAVQPGQIVGLIGPSGAGKSTIARIAAGAIRADIGEVRLDNAAFEDWDQESLACHIGYLPQDYRLIAGTVADNISRFANLVGADPADVDRQVVEAARLAGVHEMVLRLPGGYNTPVGSAGAGLSGGQTQRIALARALYGKPRMLIFDEPSAALDAEGEGALMRAVEAAKLWGASVLMVAHRAFVLSNADWLIVINQGVIERQGPRAEVIENLRQEAAQQNVVSLKRS